MQDNSFAIYQVKEGRDYHLLRFASLDDLNRDAQRLLKDVHRVLAAARNIVFQDKEAAEKFLQGEGFIIVPNTDPEFITVRNMTLQEATVYLTYSGEFCWLEGCDTRKVDQSVKQENYDLVYSGSLPEHSTHEPLAILENLYAKFNLDRPEDFHGHSLSVSDVIVLKQKGQQTCYYTDSFGFQELSDFIPPVNALRNAEMAMEDDLNMIDGIINNGSKEEKSVKALNAPEHPPRPRHRNDPAR